MKKYKGISLMELMIVMVVLLVLTSIAIPNFRGIIERHRTRTAASVAATIRTALEMYKTNYDCYPTTTQITNINDLYTLLSPNVSRDFRENFSELISYKVSIQPPATLPTNYTVVLRANTKTVTHITATPKILEVIYKGERIDIPY